MKYLLDTNACIGWLNRSHSGLVGRLEATPAAELVICSIVETELYYGAWKSQRRVENLERVGRLCDSLVSLPFDDAAAPAYGEIRGALESRGPVIGGNDLFIAAIAMTHQLILVTCKRSKMRLR